MQTLSMPVCLFNIRISGKIALYVNVGLSILERLFSNLVGEEGPRIQGVKDSRIQGFVF